MILFGMESDLADSLARILRLDGHHVHMTRSIETLPSHAGDHIVFAGGDGPNYRETLRGLVDRCREIPVVMVNRVPENSRWLDALELGASDYCGAPFEPVQVRWLVDAVLRSVAPASRPLLAPAY
jgi:DNA-binding response OmpR family regulator